MVPGLFRAIVDEADSLLIDEAVTPLIISNSPEDEPNATFYRAADDLAQKLEYNRDFTIDRTVRSVDLTARGQDRLEELATAKISGRANAAGKNWSRRPSPAAIVSFATSNISLAKTAKFRSSTNLPAVSWPTDPGAHGLHQAIEVKEAVKVTADKENLARLSFQRFFRQYPIMGGMTGTAWEAGGELWQIYQRPVVRIPTNRPCIRKQLPAAHVRQRREEIRGCGRGRCEIHATARRSSSARGACWRRKKSASA